jgi:hypothetical protein
MRSELCHKRMLHRRCRSANCSANTLFCAINNGKGRGWGGGGGKGSHRNVCGVAGIEFEVLAEPTAGCNLEAAKLEVRLALRVFTLPENVLSYGEWEYGGGGG